MTTRYTHHAMKFLLLAIAAPLSAQTVPTVIGPYSTTANFAADVVGTAAATPGAWGTAGAIQIPIQFLAPIGYRVRILRIYGDFIAWPQSGLMGAGTSAEVGWGLKSTSPDGSTRVVYPGAPGAAPYDNSFVWIQNVVTSQNSSPRASFDFEVKVGGLLNADNIMICQPFVALNTSGLTIHSEPTFTIVYQFEQAPV